MVGILDDGLFPKWAEAMDYEINRRWFLAAVLPSKDAKFYTLAKSCPRLDRGAVDPIRKQ